MEYVSKILQIFRQERIGLNPAMQKQGYDLILDKLETMASPCRCDLRKRIHELQRYSFSQRTSSVRLNKRDNEIESED